MTPVPLGYRETDPSSLGTPVPPRHSEPQGSTATSSEFSSMLKYLLEYKCQLLTHFFSHNICVLVKAQTHSLSQNTCQVWLNLLDEPELPTNLTA